MRELPEGTDVDVDVDDVTVWLADTAVVWSFNRLDSKFNVSASTYMSTFQPASQKYSYLKAETPV